MKLMAREDIEAPIHSVWETISNYEVFELAAVRRGAEVKRRRAAAGVEWDVAFRFKGRKREAVLKVEQAQAPGLLVLLAEGKALNAQARIELTELGPTRTRLTITTEMRPVTLAARLFIQSLKLARGRLMGRYQQAVGQLATLIEARSKGRNAAS